MAAAGRLDDCLDQGNSQYRVPGPLGYSTQNGTVPGRCREAPRLTELSTARLVALATASITALFKREERAVREEGVGAGHRARAGELGYGGGSQGVE